MSERVKEWPAADPKEQAVLMATGASFIIYGGYVVGRLRRRWFFPWLAGVAVWSFLPKYLLCTRCENYGKPCDFCYGGKYAALFFKPQPDQAVDARGYLAEGVSLALLCFLPAVAARRDRGALLTYLLLLGAFEATLYQVCCSRCVIHSREPWKRDICPNYRLAKALNRLSGRRP